MWCEKCEMEFKNEELTVCPICGADLVKYNSIIDEETEDEYYDYNEENNEPHVTTIEEFVDQSKPELLISVGDEDELKRILDTLEEYLIPAFSKSSETEADMTDVFVPFNMINKALEITKEYFDDETEELSDEELDAMLAELAESCADEEV